MLEEMRPRREVRRAVVGGRLFDRGHFGERRILRGGRKRKRFIERPERAGNFRHLPQRLAAGKAERRKRPGVGEQSHLVGTKPAAARKVRYFPEWPPAHSFGFDVFSTRLLKPLDEAHAETHSEALRHRDTPLLRA